MKKFLALSLSDDIFIMPVNVNIYEQDKFWLSRVEHDKSFITSVPGLSVPLFFACSKIRVYQVEANIKSCCLSYNC